MLPTDLEPGFSDMLCLDSEIKLSKWDSMKAFLGHTVYFQQRVMTENLIGKTKTFTNLSVPRLFWIFRKRIGFVECK